MHFRKQILFLFLLSLSEFCFSQKDSSLIYLIHSEAVYQDDFIRNTFYTWTSPQQINDLRANKKLLSKCQSETKGYSLYDIALQDTLYKGMPVIQLLKQSQFSKKRFAWTNCWATSLGLGDEKYGNQLIKIVLKENSIIGELNIMNPSNPIQFFDLKGETLTCNYAIENQDRIAAIYHVNEIRVKRTQQQKKRNGTFYHYVEKYKQESKVIVYREFVIINEHMVNWSYGTEDIKSEIRSEINYLKQLQLSGKANQKGYKYDCNLEKKAEYNVNCAFETNKFINTDEYMFNKEKLQKIIDTLESDLKLQSSPITN